MNDKISQEEIDKLLNGGGDAAPAEETASAPDAAEASSSPESSGGKGLSDEEKDTLGEVGNIFMGSASTTLSKLLNNKVDITTPVVDTFENISESYVVDEDHLVVEIAYTEGLEGTVVLGLKKQDSAIIADLMMGGTGQIDEVPEIGELQISAVGEAMNQMIGTASTSLSSMLNTTINISFPDIKMLEKDKEMKLGPDLTEAPIVSIKFNLKIGEVLNSDIIQFMSMAAAKKQVELVQNMMSNMAENLQQSSGSQSVVDSLTDEMGSESAPAAPAPPPMAASNPQAPVTVQPVQFASFDNSQNAAGGQNKNLNLVMDLQLDLTVELGKAELPIKEVLELTRGSIIELDKVAGEPVELYANGKLIAKGEVVVIEDNFGLRITSIISPEQRIKEL